MVKKKARNVALDKRRMWIDPVDKALTLNEQLVLTGVSKTAYYYEPAKETPENLLYMELIDGIYTKRPYYGSRRMVTELERLGHRVNRKRVVRLMKEMALETFYPKPSLSIASKEVKKYPYLLKDLNITAPNQVWSTDITYIPVRGGFFYLVAIMDWFSRYVLSWKLSNTLDLGFCLEALKEALKIGTPEIFNSDQGVQFTSHEFTSILENRGIRISMDGKGRALDNIFIERLWRTIKYEEVYIKRYETGVNAHEGMGNYIPFYNRERPHQSLQNKTPHQVHFGF
jgi:putative transposase